MAGQRIEPGAGLAAGTVAIGVTVFLGALGLLTAPADLPRVAGLALVHQGVLTAFLGTLRLRAESAVSWPLLHAHVLLVASMAIITLVIDIEILLRG